MRRALVAVLLSVLPMAGLAQTAADSIAFNVDTERAFVAAMRVFQSGQPDSAAGLFLKFLQDHPRSHRATAAYIMGAKALSAARRYRESIRLLKDLIDIYPQSTYADDANYSLGVNYYHLGRYEDAGESLLSVCETSPDSVLTGRAERLLDILAADDLTAAQLDDLRQRARTDGLRVLLGIRRAEQFQKAGDVRQAIDLLTAIIALPPATPHVAEAKALYGRLQEGHIIKIGVALPLMLNAERPGAREVGVEFLEGMKVAVDDWNRRSANKVELEVRDTRRDPATAALVVGELGDDASVLAILGPISSNEVFAAAGIANGKGVPLITPTGTSNGIAAIGPNIFQANPDYETRGRAMAEYALQAMKAKRFGVLAPTDAVGKLIADAFIDEVQREHGDLVSVQWYYAGSTDLRSQLEAMRRTALQRKEVPIVDFAKPMKHEHILDLVMAGASQRVIDSLMELGGAMAVDSLLGPTGARIADSLRIPTERPVIKYDSLEIAVDSIDVLFAPIANADEIAVVSSQIKLYNFRAQVLGTGDWNDPAELDRNRRYTEGVLFSVEAFPAPQDPAYLRFSSEYQKASGRPPGVNALFGYDAAGLVFNVLERGATLRGEVSAALAQVRGYRGLHAPISFSDRRVNSAMIVAKYTNGKIVMDGLVDLTQPPAGEAKP